jgi:RNA polymerase sigma-70 factor (ECF subfamily)
MTQRLRSALARLPAKQADAFCLHCLEGWSYREIAAHLDARVDHVGVLISRARVALRGQIAFILSSSDVPRQFSPSSAAPDAAARGEVSHDE